MRYKVIGYIHADPAMGWGATELREQIEEELSHYGDLDVNIFVVAEPEGCDCSPVSSRVCQLGTRCCDTDHGVCQWCRGKGSREFDRGELVRGCFECKGTGRAK